MPVKSTNAASRKARGAVKRAARAEDLQRLAAGASPDSIQRRNSIFPKSFFKNARISNLSEIVGL